MTSHRKAREGRNAPSTGKKLFERAWERERLLRARKEICEALRLTEENIDDPELIGYIREALAALDAEFPWLREVGL